MRLVIVCACVYVNVAPCRRCCVFGRCRQLHVSVHACTESINSFWTRRVLDARVRYGVLEVDYIHGYGTTMSPSASRSFIN